MSKSNIIRVPVEILTDTTTVEEDSAVNNPTDAPVAVTIVDPTDGTSHTFTGPDAASVDRQIDEFWGIDDANQRALDD